MVRSLAEKLDVLMELSWVVGWDIELAVCLVYEVAEW
jgi:hypothetical protein